MGSFISSLCWLVAGAYLACLVYFVIKLSYLPLCEISKLSHPEEYRSKCFEPLLSPFSNGTLDCVTDNDTCMKGTSMISDSNTDSYEMSMKFYTYYAYPDNIGKSVNCRSRKKKRGSAHTAQLDRSYMQLQWSSFVFVSKNFSTDIELELTPPVIQPVKHARKIDPKNANKQQANNNNLSPPPMPMPILKGVIDINPEGYDGYRNEQVLTLEFDITMVSRKVKQNQKFNLLDSANSNSSSKDGGSSSSSGNNNSNNNRPKHLFKFSRQSPINIRVLNFGKHILSSNIIEGMGTTLDSRWVEQDSYSQVGKNRQLSHYQNMYEPVIFVDEVDLLSSNMPLYMWQSAVEGENDSEGDGDVKLKANGSDKDKEKDIRHHAAKKSVNITLSIDLISYYYFAYKQISIATLNTMASFDVDEEFVEEIKYWLSDARLYMFALTQVLVWVHIVVEYLAFKDDWSFFKGRSSFSGVSLSSLVFSVLRSTIIFLYLFDMDTSWVVLASIFKDIIFLIYKVKKVSKIHICHESSKNLDIEAAPSSSLSSSSSNSVVTALAGNSNSSSNSKSDNNSNSNGNSNVRASSPVVQRTAYCKLPFIPYVIGYASAAYDQHDKASTLYLDYVAITHVSAVLYPLAIGISIYSLKYYKFKSWWSWLVSSLADFVYFFGFVSLTPQLYINYKLKSVAHLPVKAFMYKIFITFVDDAFAFIIKSPLKHKLMTLRDDVIFLIFLYQWWIYPNDKTRSNEFGFAYVGNEANLKIGSSTVTIGCPELGIKPTLIDATKLLQKQGSNTLEAVALVTSELFRIIEPHDKTCYKIFCKGSFSNGSWRELIIDEDYYIAMAESHNYYDEPEEGEEGGWKVYDFFKNNPMIGNRMDLAALYMTIYQIKPGVEFTLRRSAHANIEQLLSLQAVALKDRYNNALFHSLLDLQNPSPVISYFGYRKIRGDGNCYYRSVIFGLLEDIIASRDHNRMTILRGRLAAAKEIEHLDELLTAKAKYSVEPNENTEPHPIYSRFKYEIEWLLRKIDATINFFKAVSSSSALASAPDQLSSNDEEECSPWTSRDDFEENVIRSQRLDPILILVCRLLESNWALVNQDREFDGLSFKFACQFDDVMDYCKEHTMRWSKSAEGITLEKGALAEVLHCDIRIVLREKTAVTKFMEDIVNVYSGGSGDSDEGKIGSIALLFRPGHYDLLYMTESVQQTFDEVTGTIDTYDEFETNGLKAEDETK